MKRFWTLFTSAVTALVCLAQTPCITGAADDQDRQITVHSASEQEIAITDNSSGMYMVFDPSGSGRGYYTQTESYGVTAKITSGAELPDGQKAAMYTTSFKAAGVSIALNSTFGVSGFSAECKGLTLEKADQAATELCACKGVSDVKVCRVDEYYPVSLSGGDYLLMYRPGSYSYLQSAGYTVSAEPHAILTGAYWLRITKNGGQLNNADSFQVLYQILTHPPVDDLRPTLNLQMNPVTEYIMLYPQSPPAPTIQPGNLNCDDVINVVDAVMLARLLAEDRELVVSDAGRANADCNGDGAVDTSDLAMLLRQLANS